MAYNPAQNLSYENLLLANANAPPSSAGSSMMIVVLVVVCCCCFSCICIAAFSWWYFKMDGKAQIDKWLGNDTSPAPAPAEEDTNPEE